MTTPANNATAAQILEIVKTIPGAGGYIIAMVGFSVFAWILAVWARSSQRSFTESQASMQNVVAMSENLRAAMRLDMEKCEEECREKDNVIAQLRRDRDELIRQHSIARQEFLTEAAQRHDQHLLAMVEERRLRTELAAMVETVSILTAKLDNANNMRRNTDGS